MCKTLSGSEPNASIGHRPENAGIPADLCNSAEQATALRVHETLDWIWIGNDQQL